MKIQEIETALLKPYEFNAKFHDEKQIKNVAESIRQFGWQQPIVVDKTYTIIIGHCRFEAAKLLGLEKCPVVVADKLNEKQVRKLRLLDNKTNESEWDFDKLKIDIQGGALEIEPLEFDGFDVDWGIEDTIDNPEFNEEEVSLIEKELLQCPACGYVNELKAFKNKVGEENEDSN